MASNHRIDVVRQSERVQVTGQYVGLVLLMALMSLALYNDILRNLS